MHDYIIIGGGLQGGLLTLAVKHHQPKASVLLIERGSSIGGNHTWSFHQKDVPAESRAWIEPLVTSRWQNYSVRFPGFERRVNIPYASISSIHFSNVVAEAFRALQTTGYKQSSVVDFRSSNTVVNLGNDATLRSSKTKATGVLPVDQVESFLLAETEIEFIGAQSVRTKRGVTFTGKVVIDCRGPGRGVIEQPTDEPYGGGFQKFYGFEIELQRDWPESYPVVMDACQDQSNGFRFMYSLPFSNRRVLVEDTQFSEEPKVYRAECLRNIEKFVRSKTESAWSIIREESGCLPMPLSHASMPRATLPVQGGYAGGWFHAATGYSFPLAVRFAQAVASVDPEQAVESIATLVAENQSQARFARLLNRLLYRLVKPHKRSGIFQRFYRVLSDDTISRFYSHRFTKYDAFRIVVGRPPAGLTPMRFLNSFRRQR